PLVVVDDGDELVADAAVAALFEDREPDIRPAVVGRTTEGPAVDETAPRLQEAAPVEARVRAHDDVRLEILEEPARDRWGRRAPQEDLVDAPRRAVPQRAPPSPHAEARVSGERAHPPLVLGRGALPRVVVRDLRERVVAGVRVAAVAVRGPAGQRL